MRITITQDFDTPEAAADFLARIGNPAHVVHQINLSPTRIVRTVAEDIGDAVVAGTKARKPRSDAGKVRGPQNKDAAPAAPVAQAQEAQRAELSAPPAPATKDGAPAPAPVTPPGQAAGAQGTQQPGSTPAAVSPTHDDARAELQKLHNTKGKGMDACIATIRAFGFNRVVDLPKEKLVDFIANVREQVVAQTKANALAKAAK